MSELKTDGPEIPGINKTILELQQQLSTEKAAREKAEQRAEAAEKACVEMRDAGMHMVIALNALMPNGTAEDEQWRQWRDVFGTSNAGRDYIHRSKLDSALEALKELAELCRSLPDLGYVNKLSGNPISFSPDGTLAAAEQVLKENHETTKS